MNSGTVNKEIEKWIEDTIKASQEGYAQEGFEELEPPQKSEDGYDSFEEEAEKEPDPYAGLLMTEGNKHTIRNIQMRQLARDHPHTSDFYNLMLQVRKANQDCNQREVTNLMGKLYPLYRLNGEDCVRQGPFSVETLSKCLGSFRLGTAGPKPVLDPELSDKLKEMPGTQIISGKDLKGSQLRFVYVQIEMLYRCLLDYEEAEARISLLKYRSDFDANVRKESLLCAEGIVTNKPLLRNIITVDKGKMVVCRLLAVLSPSVVAKVMSYFVDTISDWKFDTDKIPQKFYTCFSFGMTEMDEDCFTVVINEITDEVVLKLTTSELGMSFLMLALNQGQDLYNKRSDKAENFGAVWKQFFNMVSDSIGVLHTLSVPYEVFATFTKNLLGDEDLSEKRRNLWVGLEKLFCENGAICSSS